MNQLSRNAARTSSLEFRRNWKALAAASIGMGFGVPGIPLYTTGLSVNSLNEEFGWSLAQLSLLQLVGSVVLVLVTPLVGWMADRLPSRALACMGLGSLGLGYILLSTSGPSFGIFLAMFVGMYVLASPAMPTAFARVVSQRFYAARGFALGIAFSFVGVVAFFAPIFLGNVMASDWRMGYRILGVAILVAAVVVIALMPRSGVRSVSGSRQAQSATSSSRESIIPYLRRRVFVQLALSYLLVVVAIGWGPLLLIPMLRSGGVSAGTAAIVASAIGLSVVFGRLAIGLFMDRFFAPYVGAGAILITAAGLTLFAWGGPAYGIVAAVALGFLLGSEIDVLGYLTSRYYPIAVYGRMFGAFYIMISIGGGVSPLLFSKLGDATGGSTIPIMICIVVLLLAAAVIATAPRFPSGNGSDVAGHPLGAEGRQESSRAES